MNDEIQDDAELDEHEGPQERDVRGDDDAPGEWEDPVTWQPPAGGLAKAVAWVLLAVIVVGVIAGLALAFGRG